MPGDRLSGISAYRGPTKGALHVKTIFLVDSGSARGKGSAALLSFLQHVHASGEAYQAPADVEVRQEHKDYVVEEGRRDREPMCRGLLKPHRGRQVGMH